LVPSSSTSVDGAAPWGAMGTSRGGATGTSKREPRAPPMGWCGHGVSGVWLPGPGGPGIRLGPGPVFVISVGYIYQRRGVWAHKAVLSTLRAIGALRLWARYSCVRHSPWRPRTSWRHAEEVGSQLRKGGDLVEEGGTLWWEEEEGGTASAATGGARGIRSPTEYQE